MSSSKNSSLTFELFAEFIVASVDFGEEESLYDSSMTADVACLYLV